MNLLVSALGIALGVFYYGLALQGGHDLGIRASKEIASSAQVRVPAVVSSIRGHPLFGFNTFRA
jgi:hypothetical protein